MPVAIRTLHVVGYPRSGNVWATRLLARVLQAPVYGLVVGHTGTLAADVGTGAALDSPYVVQQAHAWVDSLWQPRSPHAEAPVLPWGEGDVVVHVIRDPRAVLASCVPFFEWPSHAAGLERMRQTGGVLGPLFPAWADYVRGWTAPGPRQQFRVFTVRYEDLGAAGLGPVLAYLQVHPAALTAAQEQEGFDRKRLTILRGGEMDFPFGKAAQLRHLRQGTATGWRAELTPALQAACRAEWGDLLRQYGWEE